MYTTVGGQRHARLLVVVAGIMQKFRAVHLKFMAVGGTARFYGIYFNVKVR